jgi:hypothetical protein
MPYRIAGIDVHKKMLAVVVCNVEIDSEFQFERRMFGSNPDQLRSLVQWLHQQEAEEVVMESTAQYWRPVWETIERCWKPMTHEESCLAEGNVAALAPTSAIICCAESTRRRDRRNDFRKWWLSSRTGRKKLDFLQPPPQRERYAGNYKNRGDIEHVKNHRGQQRVEGE